MKDQAQRLADDASERAAEYYKEASVWLQQNYGKALTVVGVLAAVGMAGYFFSRSMSGRMNTAKNLNEV